MLQETDMFIDIYARSMYRATLHSDLPFEPLPPYQRKRRGKTRSVWKRAVEMLSTRFHASQHGLMPPEDNCCKA